MRIVTLACLLSVLTGAGLAQTPGIPGINYFHVSAAAGGPLMPPPNTACASLTLPPSVLFDFTIEAAAPVLLTALVVNIGTPCAPNTVGLPGACVSPHSLDLAPGALSFFAGFTFTGTMAPGEWRTLLLFPPAYSGLTFSVQGLIIDPSCGTGGGLLLTNAFDFTVQ